MWGAQYYVLPQATKRLGTPLEIGTIEGHFCQPYYIIWQCAWALKILHCVKKQKLTCSPIYLFQSREWSIEWALYSKYSWHLPSDTSDPSRLNT